LGIFIIQGAGVVIAFIANLLIVRTAGEETYGIYANINNWLYFFIMICGWGLDDYFVARLPVLQAQQKCKEVNNLFFSSLVTVGCATACFILMVLIGHDYVNRLLHIDNTLLILVCASIVFLTFFQMIIAFLRGLHYVGIGQVMDKILRPTLLLGLLCILYFVMEVKSIGSLLSLYTSIFALLMITASIILFSRVRYLSVRKIAGRIRLLFKESGYFLINNIFTTLAQRIDIFMLSLATAPLLIGYYNIAQKYADVVLYPIMIVNILIPAYLSKYNYLEGKTKVFELIKNGSLIMLIGTGLLFSATVIFGNFLFSVYGKNFLMAFPSFLFLSGSHFFTALTGPINAYLLVSGDERKALQMTTFHALATAVLSYAGIRIWGITGAAIGSFGGNLAYSILINIYFFRKHKVIITPFKVYTFAH
jgi:O-antigen/teichoic acid export membrane protein